MEGKAVTVQLGWEMAERGQSRHGTARPGSAVEDWLGKTQRGMARPGLAMPSRRVTSRLAMVWRGEQRYGRRGIGWVWPGRGQSERGKADHGLGWAGPSWLAEEWRSEACPGASRLGKARSGRLGTAAACWAGEGRVGPVRARQAAARCGAVRPSRNRWDRQSSMWLGPAGYGRDRQAPAVSARGWLDQGNARRWHAVAWPSRLGSDRSAGLGAG